MFKDLSWPKATVIAVFVAGYVALALLADGDAAQGLAVLLGSLGVATSKLLPSPKKSEAQK